MFVEHNEKSQNYSPFVLKKQTTDAMNIFFFVVEKKVDKHSFRRFLSVSETLRCSNGKHDVCGVFLLSRTRKTGVPSQVSPPRRERGILPVIFLKVLKVCLFLFFV